MPTVAGKLADAAACAPDADGDVIRPVENAFSQTGGLAILSGNLAPKGAVVKVAGVAAGHDGVRRHGPDLRVAGRRAAGILAGEVKDGDVVVVRYEGPRGGPGMQEMLSPTAAIVGAGIRCALITDGRFSGGSRGFCVGHISPEAAARGPIAAIRPGDRIYINAKTCQDRTESQRRRDPEAAGRTASLRAQGQAWMAGPLRRTSDERRYRSGDEDLERATGRKHFRPPSEAA